MKLRSKLTIGITLTLVLIGIFVFAIPSLVGFLLTALILFAVYDLYSRRRKLAGRTLNLAMRAACHQRSSIPKIVTAFAKYGPLQGPCYEYARRLMVGEDPIKAAAASRVPLQLGTAVAMSRSATETPLETADGPAVDEASWLRREPDSLSVYTPIIYLTLVATITCLVLAYVTVTVLPSVENMFQQFGMLTEPYQWLVFGKSPTWIAIIVLVLLLLLVIPIFVRNDFVPASVSGWFPISPRAAESRAEILEGLADATESGMPFTQAIELAGVISLNPDHRKSFQNVLDSMQQGNSAADALYQTGWISADEVSWLRETQPLRFAQLLRHFARQGARDAEANLQWLLGILCPLLVVLLGMAVLSYAYGFLGMLMNLIESIA